MLRCLQCGSDKIVANELTEAPTYYKCVECGYLWKVAEDIDIIQWLVQEINKLKEKLQ